MRKEKEIKEFIKQLEDQNKLIDEHIIYNVNNSNGIISANNKITKNSSKISILNWVLSEDD